MPKCFVFQINLFILKNDPPPKKKPSPFEIEQKNLPEFVSPTDSFLQKNNKKNKLAHQYFPKME